MMISWQIEALCNAMPGHQPDAVFVCYRDHLQLRVERLGPLWRKSGTKGIKICYGNIIIYSVRGNFAPMIGFKENL